MQGQLESVQKELKAAKERGDQQDKLLIRSARRITALEGENSALKVALQAVRVVCVRCPVRGSCPLLGVRHRRYTPAPFLLTSLRRPLHLLGIESVCEHRRTILRVACGALESEGIPNIHPIRVRCG